MHNIHYVIVSAEDYNDAEMQVEDILLDWMPNEDNYFSIIGSIVGACPGVISKVR